MAPCGTTDTSWYSCTTAMPCVTASYVPVSGYFPTTSKPKKDRRTFFQRVSNYEAERIMKTIKEEYNTQIEKIKQEIELVKQDNLELRRSNEELTCLYNNLLAQNAILVEDNKRLSEKIEELEERMNEKEV